MTLYSGCISTGIPSPSLRTLNSVGLMRNVISETRPEPEPDWRVTWSSAFTTISSKILYSPGLNRIERQTILLLSGSQTHLFSRCESRDPIYESGSWRMCSRCVSFLIAAAILCGGWVAKRVRHFWGLGFFLCTQYIHVSWLLLYVKWYFQLI